MNQSTTNMENGNIEPIQEQDFISSPNVTRTDKTLVVKDTFITDDVETTIKNGQKVGVRTVTDDYTLLRTDYYVGCSQTTTITLTLPPIANADVGKVYEVKDESGTAETNIITIDGNGSETIDDATTYLIDSDYGSAKFICSGDKWSVIGREVATVAPTWTTLETKTLSSDTATVTFSSIPSDYKLFRLSGFITQDNGGGDQLLMRLNNVSSGDYAWMRSTSYGTLAPSNSVVVDNSTTGTFVQLGRVGSNYFNHFEIYLVSESSSTRITGTGKVNAFEGSFTQTSFELATNAKLSRIDLSFQFGVGTSDLLQNSVLLLEAM